MSPTRRALLGSVGGGLFAGCLGSEPRDGDAADGASVGGSSSATGTDPDPTVLKARNPEGRAVVVDGAGTDDLDGSEPGGSGGAEAEGPDPVAMELVGAAERAAELAVAPGVADADRSRIREFLDETDYDAESVYVTRAGARSCHRLRIHAVSWEPERVEYEYCRELRPPDAACGAESFVAVGLLFRLPVALGWDLSGSGSGGRSPCGRVETDYRRIDANATVEGNATALDGATDRAGNGTTDRGVAGDERGDAS